MNGYNLENRLNLLKYLDENPPQNNIELGEEVQFHFGMGWKQGILTILIILGVFSYIFFK